MTDKKTIDQENERSEIIRVLREYHAAMVDARIEDLDKLLDKDYSLIHITGYSQPKNEWFEVIRSGRFDYHNIDIDESKLSIEINNGKAVVAGRGIFDATINGMKNDWRLEFTMRFEKPGERWIVTHARYKSF